MTTLVPPEPAAGTAVDLEQHAVDLTTRDSAQQRTALLDATATLAARLRRNQRAARALTVTVLLGGGSRVERTRTLPAPTGRSTDLRAAADALYEALALQRVAVCGIAVRVESCPRR